MSFCKPHQSFCCRPQNPPSSRWSSVAVLILLKLVFVKKKIACGCFVFQRHAEKLSQVEADQVSSLEAWQADAIKLVWSDHGVQSCYDRRREFQLSDSAK